MWLPFIPRIRRSRQNGWIIVTTHGEVWVGGVKQTSTRYADLWNDAFVRSAELLNTKVSNVLMLGLAGGGALSAIHATYPGCRITAVEFDPVMVDIAKDLHTNKPYPFPDVIVADAKEALSHLGGTYDLIMVDIFNGTAPSPHVDDGAFWELIKSKLSVGGVAVLNVAIHGVRMYTAQKYFVRHLAWQYGANTFCALSN